MSRHENLIAALRAAGWHTTAARVEADPPDAIDCEHIAEGLRLAHEDPARNSGTDFGCVSTAIAAAEALGTGG